MPLPQPPEGATRNVVSRRMTGKGRDWKIVRGYCGEEKMPPFLFFLLLSFNCSECVPVALATSVVGTQKSYMQVPKMFVLEYGVERPTGIWPLPSKHLRREKGTKASLSSLKLEKFEAEPEVDSKTTRGR